MAEYIYCTKLNDSSNPPVRKIGHSNNPFKRVQALSTGLVKQYKLFATVRITGKDENARKYNAWIQEQAIHDSLKEYGIKSDYATELYNDKLTDDIILREFNKLAQKNHSKTNVFN